MCVTFIAKLVLGIINSVLFLAGLTLFIIGVLIRTVPAFSKETLSGILSTLESTATSAGLTLDTSAFSVADIAHSFAIAIICLGILLAGIAVLGNVGLKYGIKIILIVYFIITLTIFLAQVIIVLIAVIDRNAFDNAVKPHLRDTITNNYAGMEGIDATSLLWNGVMTHLECCGVDGYEDFVSSASNKWDKTISGMTYALMTPVACCKSAYLISPFTCAVAASPTSSNYMTGCYQKMWDYIMKDSGIFISIVAIILLAQLATLILTIIVIREDNKIAGIV